MIHPPWAILSRKFSDDSTETFAKDSYEDLSTASGNGAENIVDYIRGASHDWDKDFGVDEWHGHNAFIPSRGELRLFGGKPALERRREDQE